MAQTHLIVGAGNMGGALLSGWLKAGLVGPKNVAILDPSPGVEAVYAIERGARHLADASQIGRNVQTVLIAVKPQIFADINAALSETLTDDTLVVSIMAGTQRERLANALPHCVVVRAMPNMPASVGHGMTAYLPPDNISHGHVKRVEALLGASGAVVQVATDDAINAVTAVSGSGPAYLFHICEALAEAGRSMGLDAKTADRLARQTVIGAGELLAQSTQSPTDLRKAVTSPGGTTQAALDVLMHQDRLGKLMRETVQAAYDRAKALSD